MEQILQMVSGSELFSLLDIFSGYNTVLVSEQDCLKTTFHTKWGTFTYRRNPQEGPRGYFVSKKRESTR